MIEFERPLPEPATIDDLVERYRSLTIERAAMRKLKEHPGWPAYMAILKGNLKVISQSLEVTLIESTEHALHLNFEKGKAFSLRMMMQLIEAVDGAYEQELQKLEVQIEEKRHGGWHNGSTPEYTDDSSGSSERAEPELPFARTGSDQLAP